MKKKKNSLIEDERKYERHTHLEPQNAHPIGELVHCSLASSFANVVSEGGHKKKIQVGTILINRKRSISGYQ